MIARNNSGVWNDAGAALDFSIAPAYYQTNVVSHAVASRSSSSLLWAAHQYRLRRIAREFDLTLRRARQRAHPHRARTARHAASELPRSAAAIPDGVVPAAGASSRGESTH